MKNVYKSDLVTKISKLQEEISIKKYEMAKLKKLLKTHNKERQTEKQRKNFQKLIEISKNRQKKNSLKSAKLS